MRRNGFGDGNHFGNGDGSGYQNHFVFGDGSNHGTGNGNGIGGEEVVGLALPPGLIVTTRSVMGHIINNNLLDELYSV